MTDRPSGLEATRLDLDERGVAWITLNRPDSANARNQRMRGELALIIEYLSKAADVRVVVLTGAGERFFCAGMDLKEAAEPETVLNRWERLKAYRDIEQLAALPQATIAAINGYALGGGLEMAVACDIRVVAEEAQVGLPELRHGLVPGGGGTQRLPRLVGASAALRMLYLSESVPGREAVTIGLAELCVPLSELRSTVDVMAGKIAQLDPLAVRTAKELVRRSEDTPLAAGLRLETDALTLLLGRS
jgi:enoyl-CoA hydratase/carnithine racemase